MAEAGPQADRPMVFDVGMYPTEAPQRMAQVARLAEELGYDTLWLGDSHLIWREAYVTLAHIAGQTKRLGLGTGVTNCVTRHVTVLASAWATLQELSGGRAVVGIGVGDTALRTMGAQPARLKDLRDTVGIMRRLLAGEDAEVQGQRVHLATPPFPTRLYLSASGPKTLELAGEIGDGAIFPVGVAPAFIQSAQAYVASGARRGGRGLADVDLVCWSVCCIRDDAELAMDAARSFVASILRHPLPYELSPADREAADRIRAHYDVYQHMDAGSDHRQLVPADTMHRFALTGTAEQVLAQIRELRRVGIRRVAIVVLGPQWEETLVRFARDVVTAIRREEGR